MTTGTSSKIVHSLLPQALREWVAVESDSSDVTKRQDLHRMMDMTAEKLKGMGAEVEMVDIGSQEVRDKNTLATLFCCSV